MSKDAHIKHAPLSYMSHCVGYISCVLCCVYLCMCLFVCFMAFSWVYVWILSNLGSAPGSLLGAMFPMPHLIWVTASDGLLFKFMAVISLITKP